ncbi:MAG: site-specific integrase, partial [Gammaproteobacteria bacterium]|nr:site-specific integrase [Gammaproteobacteria bacterium]
MAANYTPQAIFDQADLLKKSEPPAHVPASFHSNYQQATEFLLSYRYNDATFNSYRREIEKFCQWAWFVAATPFAKLKREDIENYLLFCRKPPNDWIGVKNVMRFIEQDGKHIPNPEWRPFVVSMPKAQRKTTAANRAQYQLSEKGFR